jgi:hypothetical protein
MLCAGWAALVFVHAPVLGVVQQTPPAQQKETPEEKKMREDMEKASKEFNEAMKKLGQDAPHAAGKAAAGCAVGLISCIAIPIVWFAVGIILLIWVNNDAKARGDQNAVIWMVVLLLAHVMGLIVYLVVRPKGNLAPCASCHKSMLESLAKCPHCGVANASPKPSIS